MIEMIIHYLYVSFGVVAFVSVGALIGKFLIEAIGNIKDFRIKAFTKTAVYAAAQKIPDKSKRYAWVAQQIYKKFKWVSEAELEVLIEAAVKGFKKEFGATVPPSPAT